jgi:hypothetical protein
VVRVILISRGTGLVSRLAATLDDRSRGMLNRVHELPVGPFGGADDRARWFAEAVRVYAGARRTPPPDLPAHPSGSVTDPAELILTLHAQALLAVLDSEGSRPMRARAEGLPFDQVVAALFAHEQHRWQTSAQRPEFGLTDLTSPVQAHAIAALLLASPADERQTVAALSLVPEMAKASVERLTNTVRWAALDIPRNVVVVRFRPVSRPPSSSSAAAKEHRRSGHFRWQDPPGRQGRPAGLGRGVPGLVVGAWSVMTPASQFGHMS